MTTDNHVDVDGYVDGELDTEQSREVESHLAGCATCREEVNSLRELQSYLQEVPPEALLDGPPADADLLLQRTLRQVRQESARTRTGRGAVATTVSIAAVAAVLAAAGGVLIGRNAGPDQPLAVPEPTPSASSSAVPGTRFASSVDPSTGARLTVRVEPASGFVRVNVAVTGLPAGEPCRLIVVGKDGRRETAGSWLVSEKGAQQGTTLDGTALIDPDDVTAVMIENTSGQKFVSTPV
ncbi:anti-sigma factor [Kribbella sp. ALI-6-A]|uniref:anti-sigma factor family protein n=1 Tax=Kribbella sp. ALI-6-A TaxID=1933817 RepID=UPI00097BEA9B|nr:zf-HC2 domain-containing protein [Kribbella sp. ALI-6-A]ONI66820.1 anti-sigma factor [Kribbella sp. ALI-6-A]